MFDKLNNSPDSTTTTTSSSNRYTNNTANIASYGATNDHVNNDYDYYAQQDAYAHSVNTNRYHHHHHSHLHSYNQHHHPYHKYKLQHHQLHQYGLHRDEHRSETHKASSAGGSSSGSSNEEHSQSSHSQNQETTTASTSLSLAENTPITAATTVTSSDSTATTTTTNANSKHPRSTFPFGKCKVCNDEASGVHYGVATCEGCKGFFKRCILRKEKYRCFFGSTCPVMPDNRNKCKACRFKRCLDAGMSMDGIKMGRIPKAERERAMLNEQRELYKKNDDDGYSVDIDSAETVVVKQMTNEGASTSKDIQDNDDNDDDDDDDTSVASGPSEAQIEYLQNLTAKKTNSNMIISKSLNNDFNVLSVVETSRHLYEASSANTKQLLQRAHNLIRFGVKQYVGHNASLYDVWEGLIDGAAVSVKKMIGYTKGLPGFNDANPQDFGTIIKNRLFEFYMLQNVPLIIGDEAYLMLPNDIQYSRNWMNKIIGKEFADYIIEFGNELNKIELTGNEFALLVPFVLTINDYNNFDESEYLRSLHHMYSKALMYEMRLNKRNLLFMEKFIKILEFFPKLNQLDYNFRQLKPLTK